MRLEDRHQSDDLLAVGRRRKAHARLVPVDLVQRRGAGPAVEDVHRLGADQAGMLHPARLGHLDQVAAQRLDVVRDPHRLDLRHQAAGQPGVLGGDAGGTGVGMAFLGLDAADREHRFPRDIDHVAAQREADDRVVGQAELAAADEGDLLMQTPLGEDPVHPGEAKLEGQRHGVGEDQRCRAGASLAAVDGHEVDPASASPA